MAGVSTKAIKNRIRSMENTKQITKAMEMVAASKLRRAQAQVLSSRPYFEIFYSTIHDIVESGCDLCSPYLTGRPVKKVAYVVIAGDRGLAGGYNANVFRLAKEFPEAEFIPIGKRACEKYNQPTNSSESYSFEEAAALAETLCTDFAEGKFDKLGIISTRYLSVMSQEAYIKWILPFEKSEREDVSGIVFEPDNLTVLNNVAREYIAGMITICARESFASEVAARRMAMDSAEKNAQQMISDLQLEYNRARQGAITQEITEIVAGSGN